MRLFNRLSALKDKHPALFEYLPAKEVFPHDYFMDRFVLRFLPARSTPNGITILRICLTPFVFLVTLYGHYRFGVILFLLTAFTDAIDGSLARTRNKITRFGMLFDPLADKLLIGSMVLLLVFRYLNVFLGIAILGIEIIFIVSALVAKIKFKTVKMADRWGKLKMFFQVIAMSLIMIALLIDFPYLLTVAAWVFGLAIGFAILSLFRHGI
ncbi:MAG: CDP-alcohol phosphatidyltransferase family protein [Candidatus Magasanikbacteria bacterium]|nr:CDP-alcohol phosphatidyltransferase family protein [Candidatus Magasanikbacteria bacterium]